MWRHLATSAREGPDMGTPQESESVDASLRRVEADLARRLEEACEAVDRKDLGKESMDELLRLEEELLAAAHAAERAVQLRRQLGERPATTRGLDTSTPASPEAALDESTTVYRLRDFRDQAGKEWRVWQVRPRSAGRANPERYLGEYVRGWLAFELLAGDLHKRLASFPEDWLRMSDEELDRLLRRAVDVPRRKAAFERAEPRAEPR
jgi:hypothetical protein